MRFGTLTIDTIPSALQWRCSHLHVLTRRRSVRTANSDPNLLYLQVFIRELFEIVIRCMEHVSSQHSILIKWRSVRIFVSKLSIVARYVTSILRYESDMAGYDSKETICHNARIRIRNDTIRPDTPRQNV